MGILLSLCLLPCLAESVYQYTILEDSGVTFESGITPQMRDEYSKRISKLLPLTEKILGRRKYSSVPESLLGFYQDKHLRFRMNVDSPEGLRVRTRGDLKAEKICTIPYQFPVTIIALGEMATIDGIESAWVEILLPRFAWKGDSPEFGWVFGGYLKNEEENTSFCFDSSDYNGDYHDIPYHSGHLYDIDENGESYLNKYLERSSRDLAQSDPYDGSDEWIYVRYRHDREVFPEVLRMVQAGLSFMFDYTDLFEQYWQRVQVMRQIYPCALEDDSTENVNDFDYNQDGQQDSMSVVFNNIRPLLRVHTGNTQTSTTLSIHEADYQDFKISSNNELEIIPYSFTVNGVPLFLVQLTRRIRDTELMHHYEYSFFIIQNNTLVKFCTIKTPSDYFSDIDTGFYFYEKNESVMIIISESTAMYDKSHDDGIGLRLVDSFPYIMIDKDDLQNFEVVRLGPSYSDESD